MTAVTSVGDGRYRLDERIATGGMGEVWRATDTVLGREVAVKLLRSEYADDATFRARLRAEARNTALLHHPGIAQVFDYGETAEDGAGRRTAAFLVMELVEGEPLSALLARERGLDPERARDLVAQAATAVAVAHQSGIVHRDIKPANLLVTPGGAVKVTDFGIARAVDSVPLTETGQVVGTPHYLSPEQARGQQATAASDIYSLGVVLYECLAGARPFTAESPIAVAMQHLRDDAPPLPGTVPSDLADLCLCAMAKDPAARVPSAGELAARLREPGLASGGPTAGAAGAAATTPLDATPADPTLVGAPVGPHTSGSAGGTAVLTGATVAADTPRRRRGWLVPALVAAAVVAVVGAAALALSTGGGEPSPAAAPDKAAKASPVASADGPQRVRVDPADYRGRPYEDARADLSAQGFEVSRESRVGGGGEPGTVDSVQPHGLLRKGAGVTLGVWKAPESKPDGAPVDEPGPLTHDKPAPEKPKPEPPAKDQHGKHTGKGHGKGKAKD